MKWHQVWCSWHVTNGQPCCNIGGQSSTKEEELGLDFGDIAIESIGIHMYSQKI